jgi:hypothetical protein
LGGLTVTTENRIRKLLAQYRVNFHDLRTPITITLWHEPSCDHIAVAYSHLIKTPTQIGPYAPDYLKAYDASDSTDAIVSRLVSIMDSFYQEAVNAGHVPSESWIVPQSMLGE